MPCCLIGLGSNLGDRRKSLDDAVARLDGHTQMRLTGTSSFLETCPIGGPPGQSAYLNGAIVAETSLPPPQVLEVLQQIETDLGRRREVPWGPRPIDLDLLLYDRLVLDTPSLVLPHPRMAWRRFVLRPAAEVAGSMVHPPTGWTVARLLEHLDTAAPYVAITGSIGAGKTHLAERLARKTAARRLAEPLDLEQLATFYADPSSHAWATELEFLRQRTQLLAADSPQWSQPKRLTVGDFWFDQSLAFARVWLPAGRLAAFEAQWERSRRRVVRPKLIVLLDAPGAWLLGRVLRRGRTCERGLSAEQLERIRRAVLDQTRQPDLGPVLQLAADDSDRVLGEVLAAVQAMQS